MIKAHFDKKWDCSIIQIISCYILYSNISDADGVPSYIKYQGWKNSHLRLWSAAFLRDQFKGAVISGIDIKCPKKFQLSLKDNTFHYPYIEVIQWHF